MSCLPADLTASMSIDGPWAASVETAMVQLRGECPDCLAKKGANHRAAPAAADQEKS